MYVASAINQVVQRTVFSKHFRFFLSPFNQFHTQKAISGRWNTGTLFNPLNVELNPICHLLILLGDLTFMGPCIVSIFQYISNKMQRYTVYLYLETAVHVSGGTSTHHQERIQLYLQHLVFVTPLLLSAAIVEKLELQSSSNSLVWQIPDAVDTVVFAPDDGWK